MNTPKRADFVGMKATEPAAAQASMKQGVWIAPGHGLAAVATLVGVRFITELAPPSLYGGFVLLNGILALLHGMLLAPMAQAALRFYPDFETARSILELRKHLVGAFARRWSWTLIVFAVAAGVDVLAFHWLNPVTWFLLAFALGLEAWKTIEIVMRNAAREQAGYSALFAADSIARPAGTVIAAWALGTSLESLLLGQSVGALLVLAGFFKFSLVAKGASLSTGKSAPANMDHLKQSMKYFAAPLLWAPILGWVSGLADRYIVGGILGLSQAGIYAAAYGLASRPILMIGAVSDATLRQLLYASVARDEPASVRKTLQLWIAVNLLAGAFAAALLSAFADPIVRWLLADEYRSVAARLLPWIACGYVLLLGSQALERLLYARRRTGAVMWIQATSATVAVVAAIIGTQWAGLFGVAVAVPIYLAAQLLLTIIAAALTGGTRT
jgi:O-antigen/teichoic acid export membrane protein